jgi:hypothetical protein
VYDLASTQSLKKVRKTTHSQYPQKMDLSIYHTKDCKKLCNEKYKLVKNELVENSRK